MKARAVLVLFATALCARPAAAVPRDIFHRGRGIPDPESSEPSDDVPPPPTSSPDIPTPTSCDVNGTTCGTVTTSPTSEVECIPVSHDTTSSTLEIVYTATTTFYGNPTDYTPPYPPITITSYCPWPTEVPMPTGGSNQRPLPLPTTTFVTTDKNPFVIYSPTSELPPGYSSTDPVLNEPGQHTTAQDWGDEKPTKDAPKHSAKPTFTVTAGSDYVVIGDTTFSRIQPTQTTTVVAGGGTFTIFPTAVIGEGTTVARPAPAATIAPSPTSTNIAGLPISVSGSVVEIDGRTITIPPEGTTTLINGEHVSLDPGTVVVAGSETFTWADTSVQPTQVRVVGGETVTGIGSTILVLHSTTITYGPGIDPITTPFGDGLATIGPKGFVFNSETFGPGDDPVVATFEAKGSQTSKVPVETGSNSDVDEHEDDDDAAGSMKPDVLFTGLSVFLAVWAFL